ncbi:methionine synthase [uncultured Pseudokineococcus sp.]|uniref:methionine synthase n=1 Tax=uncultured Pseudokineococcus sp. TaxID=1642928 RepID=UPI002628EF13|nr:methionine synthase [uncultured Pseudokineococcus sp.]
MSDRPQRLRAALAERVLVADGAMGTMLQAAAPGLEDFEGHEGCNEVLNATRPDVVRSVHEAYLDVGVDLVETNTFGANWANLAEYGIESRIRELAAAGARVAREAADGASTADHERFVLGSMGPGTKLPSLGHAPYALLRDAYAEQVLGMLDGGVDAVLVETVQDLLQAKAAVVGARRAMREAQVEVPVLVQVTVETTGTMLLGSEIGAALTALAALGVDGIGLNCATGPAEMGEHLRHLARHAAVPVTAMPNAGLPQLSKDGAYYPLSPAELAEAHDRFTREFGLALVGGCCGTTPEHLRQVVERVGGRPLAPRDPRPEPGVASIYQHVPFAQDASVLSIGERTNANGSKAFREAMVAGDWERCVEIARGQTRDGAHLLDVCVDYVGRDGVADVKEVVSRLATASTLPLVIDSTEPAVIEAGLELVGGRAVVNSVNYEDGDGPGSRFARIMPLVREHGAAVVALTIDEQGQARTAETKAAIATRLVEDLTGTWGMDEADVVVDALTFPIATGQEETRRDGVETLEAIREIKRRHPRVQTTLGLSNISFGLNPAARAVLNSVFLHEAVEAGLDSAIVHAARIMPMASIPDEQREAVLDLVHDRRRYDDEGAVTYDPLQRVLDLFEGVDAASVRADRAAELLALPLGERLSRRIVDGERKGLDADLDEALAAGTSPLDVVNDHLLAGMKEVGELFGSGQMQLPFVLQSAEVMKAAVAHLEPHIEAEAAASGTARQARAKIVLATVKGDVHDIGKNLVDIILSNNGYDVTNIGIKQPISEIIRVAEETGADAIGMSGLLVKSTVVMKENLAELNDRGLAARWPVILGGAALTRAYVETDLAEMYEGEVRYARDAFEGLRLMDAIAAARTTPGASVSETLPALRPRRVRRRAGADDEGGGVALAEGEDPRARRSDVARDVTVPVAPFWGTRVVKGVHLADYASYLDERATFLGQWGLRGARGGEGPSYEELVETEGRPRLRMWLDRVRTEGITRAAVVYGYFPCWSEGQDLVVAHHEGDGTGGEPGTERLRFSFPRQRRDRRLCLADFFRDRDEVEALGRPDVLPLQLVTMGSQVAEVTGELFARNAYREYLELHGLSVQLTEAMAEMWHARVRTELGFGGEDAGDLDGVLGQGYRGSRYSFGYPACPDLESRRDLVRLLEPERIGVELSEELQLHPEQSTDALVVHHPEAKYFNAV